MGKKKAGDFVKKTQKVGKKKLAPTSHTSTRFKTKSVALPEQSQFAATEEPVSHRRLTATALLAQLSHYTADVRCDALKGLVEVLSRNPEVLPPIAPTSCPMRSMSVTVVRYLSASAPKLSWESSQLIAG